MRQAFQSATVNARGSVSRHAVPITLLTLAVVAVPICLAIWKIPQWQVGTNPLNVEEKARIDAETAARVALIQGVGGLLLFTTAGISWFNLKATERNVLIAEEKQVTERFSKAVEMLGNENSTYIRLGGIYALERIAKDSAKDHWQVMEILTAFVREKARLQNNQKPFQITYLDEEYGRALLGVNEHDCYEEYEEELTTRTPTKDYIHPIAVEIQAVLTALGRRTRTHENGKQHILNLSRTDLRGAILTRNLAGIDLEGANLQWAILKDVDLSQSKLAKANLEVVKVERVNLQQADLQDANLEWAEFVNTELQATNLENANLRQTKFQGCDLTQANLKSAKLWKAELPSSMLEQANLESAELISTNLSQANLKDANLKDANLWDANLEKTNLENANLRKANLEKTNLENANLRRADFEETILRTASLDQADFDQAKLSRTRLDDADLSAVLNLTPEQVKSAKYWKTAIYSPEFRQEMGLPPATVFEEVLEE